MGLAGIRIPQIFEYHQEGDLAMSEFTLEKLGLVDALDEEAFDNLTQLASYITKSPVSLISFVQTEKNRQYFKSQVGLT